jgi:hypothetical protein
VAVRDLEVTARGAQQVQPPADGFLFGTGADRALQEGKVWQLDPAAGHFSVRLPTLPPTAQTKVLLAQQDATCVGPARWLHEARYLVHAREKGELRLALPPGARWLAAAVDGQPVLPVTASPDELVLPLSEGQAPWLVQVRWDYPQGVEMAAGPERARPRLLGCEVLAQQAGFSVPPGFRRPGPAAPSPGPQAEELFERAQAYRRLTDLLAPGKAEAARPGLLPVQQNFFSALRHLERVLAWQAATQGSPQVEAFKEKAQKLRQENLASARTHGYDALRKRAENEAWAAPGERHAYAPLIGGEPFVYDEAAAVPRLRSSSEELTADRRLISELVMLIGVSLLLVSYLRHGLSLLHVLWPELLALLAGLGLAAWGISPIGVSLLLFACGARLLFLSRQLRAWLARRRAVADEHDAAASASV